MSKTCPVAYRRSDSATGAPRADAATGGGTLRFHSSLRRRRNGCNLFTVGIRSSMAAKPPLEKWWRWPGSNRRPPACKAGALPTELHPRPSLQQALEMVGLTGVEPVTSPLSGARSNHLSYRPTPVRSLAGNAQPPCLPKNRRPSPKGGPGLSKPNSAKLVVVIHLRTWSHPLSRRTRRGPWNPLERR